MATVTVIQLYLFAFMCLCDPRFWKAIMALSLRQENVMMEYSTRKSDCKSEESSDRDDV